MLPGQPVRRWTLSIPESTDTLPDRRLASRLSKLLTLDSTNLH